MALNPYCEVLGIEVPSLSRLKDHPEANTFSLLVVALLEHGGPLTLPEVAGRFEAAGIRPATWALRSLRRCRPDRAPVVRDGDRYDLDPHTDALSWVAFRLGLRPLSVPPVQRERPAPEPLPGPEAPLSAGEIDEAFRNAYLWSWSGQRLALAILDAHGGRLGAAAVPETLNALTRQHPFRLDALQIRRGSPLGLEAGTLFLDPTHPALPAARRAVRQRVELVRRHRAAAPTPEEIAEHQRRYHAARAAHGAELARLRRVLVHAFPAEAPEAVTLVDVATRELTTFIGGDIASATARLAGYDLIGAVQVRALLRSLGFEPGSRRLAELGPPQKTISLNRRGRTLRITLPMLVSGSCGIGRPFAEPEALRRYLDAGQTTRFRRRLEADAKSLFALYQYGRLHGGVRLRWGFLDELLGVPWVHRDEPGLFDLENEALERGVPLEVVIGGAPGWSDPWARAVRCHVRRYDRYGTVLMDEEGFAIEPLDVQLARLAS